MEIRKSHETILEEETSQEIANVKDDKEVIAIQGKIQQLGQEVASLIIADEKTGKYGTDLLSFIKTAWNNLEIKRKFFVAPLNAHIKNINSEFKQLQEPLEEFEKELKVKLLSWHKELEKRAEEEAKRFAEEEARKQEIAKKTAEELGLSAPELTPIFIEPEKMQVRGALGSTHLRKHWTFEVIDQTQVPDKYKIIDRVAVNNAIRAGERDIAGIRIYEEDIIAGR